MESTRGQTAIRVSRNTIIGNLILSLGKAVVGLLAGSAALLSDAAHSASDVVSTVVVMIGVKLSGQAEDADHQYGHERLECVAAILLSVLLLATGLGIGWSGVRQIWTGAYGMNPSLSLLAMGMALVSILSKEAMYWYTRAAAKRVSSSALMADAWHHRSDALSSVGSLLGILGARMGYPVLDSLACLVISLLVAKAAVDIFRDAVRRMTDTACDSETEERIRALALDQEGVLGVDELKTRLFGDRIYVELEILADGSETLTQAHNTAHRVHDAVEREFPLVKHCSVHVNPHESEKEM